jgi:hypothetical protein
MLKRYVLVLLTLAFAVSSAGGAAPTARSRDLMFLSSDWWGMSPDEFLEASQLQSGEYTRGADPANPQFTVILPSSNGNKRWEPSELPPFVFKFAAKGGLFDISGFYRGDIEAVRKVLTKRYGPPKLESHAMGMSAYGWEIGRTLLDLRVNIFALSSRDKHNKE